MQGEDLLLKHSQVHVNVGLGRVVANHHRHVEGWTDGLVWEQSKNKLGRSQRGRRNGRE